MFWLVGEGNAPSGRDSAGQRSSRLCGQSRGAVGQDACMLCLQWYPLYTNTDNTKTLYKQKSFLRVTGIVPKIQTFAISTAHPFGVMTECEFDVGTGGHYLALGL